MADTWDRMTTWDLVLPPSRPSGGQLEDIRDTIEHTPRSAPVAVLGSTRSSEIFCATSALETSMSSRGTLSFISEPRR